jgi:hypothetical protein
MPGSAWFVYGVVLVGGVMTARPVWETYTEEGLQPAIWQLMWSVFAWLMIGLLMTQPARLSTASLLRSAMANSL